MASNIKQIVTMIFYFLLEQSFFPYFFTSHENEKNEKNKKIDIENIKIIQSSLSYIISNYAMDKMSINFDLLIGVDRWGDYSFKKDETDLCTNIEFISFFPNKKFLSHFIEGFNDVYAPLGNFEPTSMTLRYFFSEINEYENENNKSPIFLYYEENNDEKEENHWKFCSIFSFIFKKSNKKSLFNSIVSFPFYDNLNYERILHVNSAENETFIAFLKGFDDITGELKNSEPKKILKKYVEYLLECNSKRSHITYSYTDSDIDTILDEKISDWLEKFKKHIIVQ